MLAATAAAALAGCGGGGKAAACKDADGELDKAAFVFVVSPASGARVSSGFQVSGCSSTFEGNVTWALRSRSGRLLARGHAQGGSQAPGSFGFTVSYTVAAQEIGNLTVAEPPTTSEGFPPPADVVPVVLGT